MTDRCEWTREIETSEILRAAKERYEHFRARMLHWRKERLAAIEQIRTSGVRLGEEEIASITKNFASGGAYGAASIRIDQELVDAYRNAENHEGRNRQLAADAYNWALFLSGVTEEKLTINQNDYTFFFGWGGIPGEAAEKEAEE